MSKKCTPLWREAPFQVKMLKAPHVRTTFGRSNIVLHGRRKGLCPCRKWGKGWGFCGSLNFQLQPPLHCTALHSTQLQLQLQLQLQRQQQLHYITLHYTNYNYNYNTLHYTLLRYTITLHYTTPDHTTPHYTRLHYTTLDYATLLYIRLHSLHHRNCNCNRNYTTPQLQLHYVTNYNYSCATPHYIQQLWVRWPTRWPLQPLYSNHSKKHNSNHLAVHQWIRFAIRDSQQPSSPIGFLVWNFCHRLVRQYWYLVFFKK